MSEKTPANVADSDVSLLNENDEKVKLIKELCAKDCTMSEFKLLLHLANAYELDPLSRQIWAVKYGNEAARIFAGRDGFLAFAHRSGQFDGIESGIKKDEDNKLIGWASVFRKDISRPFSVEVYEDEYNTHRGVWAQKPRTMLQKVAEVQALRKAFSITGLYSPEEIDDSHGPSLRVPENMGAINNPNACSVCGRLIEANLQEKIQAETGGKPMCRNCFNKWWEEKAKANELQEEFKAEVKPVTNPEPNPEQAPSAEKPDEKDEKKESDDLTTHKCETCGKCVTKDEAKFSQFHLGAGHFMCKPCFDERQVKKRQEVEAAKAARQGEAVLTEKAPVKTESTPAATRETRASKPQEMAAADSTGTGIVCEICGAENVPANVAQMAWNFTGKRLCHACLAAHQRGGAE